MFTIVTFTKFPNGKWHAHEIECTTKRAFDRIIGTFVSRMGTRTAYLVNNETGKLVDSYVPYK